MGMGGDSTLGGQTFFMNINKGICNATAHENGPCTVYGGNVKIMFADGTLATPAQGKIYCYYCNICSCGI
jgi:hypothetical protein